MIDFLFLILKTEDASLLMIAFLWTHIIRFWNQLELWIWNIPVYEIYQ